MQSKNRFLIFSLAGFLTLLLLSRAIKPVSGSGLTELNSYAPLSNYLLSDSDQTSDCISMLMEAAQQGGVEGTLNGTDEYSNDDGRQVCVVDFRVYNTNGSDVRLTGLSMGMHPIGVECNLEGTDGYTTFHGYDAQIETNSHDVLSSDVPETGESKSIYWLMERGGRCHFLSVRTATHSIESYGAAADPLPMANALWSIAEDGLPLAVLPVDNQNQPSLPVNPVEVVPGQPEVPTDMDGLFDIPLAVILGSLGIPVAGAIAGAVLSTILSGISSAATSSSATTTAPVKPPYSRELDPDEISDFEASGKSKADYIRAKTRANLSRNLGEEFEKFSPADQANLVDFHQRVHDLIREKKTEGYYVKNPDDDWSIPFLPSIGVKNIVNEWIDPNPISLMNNFKGGRCGEYTDWGKSWTKELLDKTGFRGQDICVSDIEMYWSPFDNHGANEARFASGKVVVDFQKSFQTGKPVIWSEKNWITVNSVRSSMLLFTPEVRYDGVSGNKDSLTRMFKFDKHDKTEIPSRFIEKASDKAEARAILREFYDECVKENSLKDAPRSSGMRKPTKPDHSGARTPKQ